MGMKRGWERRLPGLGAPEKSLWQRGMAKSHPHTREQQQAHCDFSHIIISNPKFGLKTDFENP